MCETRLIYPLSHLHSLEFLNKHQKFIEFGASQALLCRGSSQPIPCLTNEIQRQKSVSPFRNIKACCLAGSTQHHGNVRTLATIPFLSGNQPKSNGKRGAGTALPADLGSISRTTWQLKTTCNSSLGIQYPLPGLCRHSTNMVQKQMQAKRICFLRGIRPGVSLLTGSCVLPRPPQAVTFLCLSPSTAQWSHSPGASLWVQHVQLIWSAAV